MSTISTFLEVEIAVSFTVIPGCKGTLEHGTGLQMEPDEPETVEIATVQVTSPALRFQGVDFDKLSKDAQDAIHQAIEERLRL